jgi:lipoprotein NlpD
MHVLRRAPYSAYATITSLILATLLAGCGARGLAPVDDRVYGPAPPGFYRVRSGDTLSEIAERKRIKMRELAAWNDLSPPYPLYAGGLLRIKPPKGGAKARKVATRSPTERSKPAKSASAATGARPGSAARGSGVAWAWPIRGPVVQSYRAKDRTRQGVRIAAPEGSPVAAAADGTVVYSGSSGLAGYGNLIIVKHNPRYLSAYGFNRRVTAREGTKVKRGQQLAEVGRSADGQPMLHFEIRRDGATVDPLLFLPATR